MIAIIVWVLLVVLISVWANNWGRKASNYFWLSFFLSPLVGALVLLIKGKDEGSLNQRKIDKKEMKQCPYCRELINYTATVCKFCGKSIQTDESHSVNQTSQSYNTTSYTSSSYSNTSHNEKSHFYTFETLDEEKKSITNEYIDKVIECTDLEKVLEIQKPYFGTSSLEYLKALLPDANDFTDCKSYKTKMKEAKSKLNGETFEEQNSDKSMIENSLEEKLIELKALYDKGLIDENDYKMKKDKILGIE